MDTTTNDAVKQTTPLRSDRNDTRVPNEGKRFGDDAERRSSSKRKQSTPLRVVSPASDEEEGSGDVVVMETELTQESCDESNSVPQNREQDNGRVVAMQGSLGRHVPVHCTVEVSTGNFNEDGSLFYLMEVDDFTLVPHDLPVSKLPKAALIQLGYGLQPATTVTGYIQIVNWKPLTLESITDDPQVSVEYLFANLTNVATLRIQITSHPVMVPSVACVQSETDPPQQLQTTSATSPSISPEPTNTEVPVMNDIKDKLQQLLKHHKQSLLVSHGCPFSQAMISQVIQGKYINRISSDKANAFYKWYEIYLGLSKGSTSTSNPFKKKPSGYRRTRTLFDPKDELPRLRRWFRDHPRPSREQMLMYLYELNNLERRKKGTLLQFSSILLWFKNARAKYKTNDCIFPTRATNDDQEEMNTSVSPSPKVQENGNSSTDTSGYSGQGAFDLDQGHNHLESSGSGSSLMESEETPKESFNQRESFTQQGLIQTTPVSVNPQRPHKPVPVDQTGANRCSPTVNRASQSLAVNPRSSPRVAKGHDSMKIAESIIETATVAEALYGRRKRHRFSIHPLYEVPKLKTWFMENPRPDYTTKERIMQKLNASPFRVGREKWTVKTVTVWFKNARAKMYRNELFNDITQKPTSTQNATDTLGTAASTLGAATSLTSQKIIFPVSIAASSSSRSHSPKSLTPSDAGTSASVEHTEPITTQVKIEVDSSGENEPPTHTTHAEDISGLKASPEITPSASSSKSLLAQVKVERSHDFSPFGSEGSDNYRSTPSLASPQIMENSQRYLSPASLASPANSESSSRFHTAPSLISPVNSESSQRFQMPGLAISPANSEESPRYHSTAPLVSPSQIDSPHRYYGPPPLTSLATPETPQKRPEQEKVFQINSTFELPKLKKCFQENPYPTSDQIEHYVEMLNSLPLRQVQSQKYNAEILTAWFDLERQKCFPQTPMPAEQCVASPSSSSINSEDIYETETEWNDVMVRKVVMELLKEINQTQLGQISPLTQSMVSCIVNSKYSATISKEKCEEFGRWYELQRSRRELQQKERVQHFIRYMPGRKLSFHPEYEIPRMKEWFGKYQHPTDMKLQEYSDIMNADPFRRQTGRPITVTNLRVWWKNERAKRNKEARDTKHK